MRLVPVGAVVSFLLLFFITISTSQLLRRCDPVHDLVGHYSQCSTINSTRDLYYYFNRDCDSSHLPTPAPETGLACNIDCDPGWYLPLNGTECQICTNGTFSLGGGVRFHIWDSLPQNEYVKFDTYCSTVGNLTKVNIPGCIGWNSGGYEIDSGDMTGKSSLSSILSIDFDLLVDGSVGFRYMYNTESEGDIFGFIIDDVHKYKLDQTIAYLYESVPLLAGHHTFKWVYYKNPDVGLGADIARITFIEVVGIQAADDISCTSCAPGMYQPLQEQRYCSYCPENTYAPDFKSTQCLPCPEGTYSFNGAASCLAFDAPCDPVDNSVYKYSDCQYNEESSSWTRTKYYEWNLPLLCDKRNIDLPDNETNIPCSACSPGYFIQADGSCGLCGIGTYSNGNELHCSECGSGHAAVGQLYFNSWDTWNDNYFETFCYGRCPSSGWQLYSDFIRATLPSGVAIDMLLQLDVSIYFLGSLEVSFFIHPSGFDQSYFEITVDGGSPHFYQTTDRTLTVKIPLLNGAHTIGFWAHGAGIQTSYVDIYSIIVTGTRDGGASECTPCPAGYYQASSKQDSCTRCELGKFSNSTGSTKCSFCPDDTFAAKPGASECTPCPLGSHSPQGSIYCQNPNCTFTYTSDNSTDFTYNLSPYAGLPQFVENSGEDFRGYYLVSYCGTLEPSDSPCTDSHLCEVYVNFNPYNPTQNFINWSTFVSFQSLPNPKDGFILNYTEGDNTGCANESRSTSVYLYCTIDSHEFTTLSLNTTSSTPCHKEFVQHTVYGCPTCHLSDFDKVEEECKNGKRTVHYNKKPDAKCNGIVKTVQEQCEQYQSDFILFSILAVFIIMVSIALIGAVVFLVLKQRSLKFKYAKLQEEKAAEVELDQIEQPTE